MKKKRGRISCTFIDRLVCVSLSALTQYAKHWTGRQSRDEKLPMPAAFCDTLPFSIHQESRAKPYNFRAIIFHVF